MYISKKDFAIRCAKELSESLNLDSARKIGIEIGKLKYDTSEPLTLEDKLEIVKHIKEYLFDTVIIKQYSNDAITALIATVTETIKNSEKK